MGYDLYPRNKKLESFHMGAFSFSWMLDEGVGLVIGCGPSMNPGEFFYCSDEQGRCPMYNDGFRVDAEHARAMSLAAYGLAAKERWIAGEWAKLTPDERAEKERANKEFKKDLYRPAVRDDFIDKAEKFAAWAWESGGFAIR
jgi:hypothetical protein